MTYNYASPGTIVPAEKTLFEYRTSRGHKVECNICGCTGYGLAGSGGFHPAGWQKSCLRGHAPCPKCLNLMPLKLDGTPRPGHAGCPGKPPPLAVKE